MNYTYYRRYQPKKKRESFSSFFWLVLFLIVSAFFLKSCFTSFQDKQEEKRDEAVLTVNKGSASITVWGEENADDASSSQIILEGDKIETSEESYATLDFYNGSKVVLDQNSVVLFKEVKKEGNDDLISLELQAGRVFVNQVPGEDGEMQMTIKTDVMNIVSYQCQYMASNIQDNEYLYVFNGEALPALVDGEAVIENLVLESGQKISIPDSKEKKLLARESLTLVEDAGGDLSSDEFYIWNMIRSKNSLSGSGTSNEEVSESYELPVESVDENIAEVDSGIESEAIDGAEESESSSGQVSGELKIKVTSPVSPASIEKNGVAIEGEIIDGTAETVTVTWDGNNAPYTLRGFKAGGTSFRFVATDEYKNLKVGANTYTVIAYDANGKASNTVVIKINASY